MIIDCYTHTWDSPAQIGGTGEPGERRYPLLPRLDDPNPASITKHLAATEPCDITIVVAFQSGYLGVEIPNEAIGEYVRSHPDRLLGFAGIDPSRPRQAIAEMRLARDELDMPGIAVAPAAQDFHPTNSKAMLVYGEAAELGMPVLFHTGPQMTAATKLEYARPVLLDEIARELPDLKIIIAHMGSPWVDETMLLLAKHANAYAEISWLLHQPWQAYHALLSASQYGVSDKLFFGSGFPYLTASCSIEAFYSINHLVHGTSFPTIPREQLRGIVERDALGALGIDLPQPAATRAEASAISEDEEL
jgi:predicted TIM-barrel fold metal-dependent hydrolase